MNFYAHCFVKKPSIQDKAHPKNMTSMGMATFITAYNERVKLNKKQWHGDHITE